MCITLHRVACITAAKFGPVPLDIGVNIFGNGNGNGCGNKHGGRDGDGRGESRNAAPASLVCTGVAQLSLLCQVMGEES